MTMATAAPASSVTGQGALLGLPSKSQLSRRGIDGYSLPDYLIQDKASLKTGTEEGLPVYKVTKVCVLGLSAPDLFFEFTPFFACPLQFVRGDVNILYPYIYISKSNYTPFSFISPTRFYNVFPFLVITMD
jgi:hypothetical protein